ncbi:MAG TPA: histidinol-phosphate transaminase, partial [Flavisolibacter sp.]|nr:histidinol-phosphate transaminase [Flavisolibacter sp.]
CRVSKIYKVGGAQAIAAMAYGTETIPAVYKIFGPGNQYVTAAKQLVQMQGVAIDMPAGPSEVCVMADDTADASFVAADLLSQAEHGPDSQVVLVSDNATFVDKVQEEIVKQLQELPRQDVAKKALANSKAFVLDNLADAIELVNEYAAEHLIINRQDADDIAQQITNAGSIFIGNYSPESVGDYASGTNHTLPTNGFAKAYSGVSVDSFVKKITVQKLSEDGLNNIASTVIQMAEAEGLDAHAAAVKVRTAWPPQSPRGDLSYAQPSPVGDPDRNIVSSQSEVRAMDSSLLEEPEGAVFDLNRLVRVNIRNLKPYSSARSEFSGTASIFLDANENSFGSPLTKWYNRYPDPLQWDVKKKIAAIKKVEAENMVLGNGSDECIDLLIRAFCNPKQDNIIICPPTYGMYEVYAHINDVPLKEVPLTTAYQLNLQALEEAVNANTKLIFFCSPNNPTGNSLGREDIEMVLNNFDGIVVVDEAYINYSRQRSFVTDLKDYPNLVVMQTFSKAWGLAALRLGMIFASKEIVHVLNTIKPPYNINQATQELALRALDNLQQVNHMIQETVKEREELVKSLGALPFVQKIFPTDANFVLVKMEDATAIYNDLREKGIIVRNRSNVLLCEDSLRITVGTPTQNSQLIEALNAYAG